MNSKILDFAAARSKKLQLAESRGERAGGSTQSEVAVSLLMEYVVSRVLVTKDLNTLDEVYTLLEDLGVTDQHVFVDTEAVHGLLDIDEEAVFDKIFDTYFAR